MAIQTILDQGFKTQKNLLWNITNANISGKDVCMESEWWQTRLVLCSNGLENTLVLLMKQIIKLCNCFTYDYIVFSLFSTNV